MEHPLNREHKTSILLTDDENERIFQLLRPNGQSIATTVVQLFSTDGPDGVGWIKRCVGVLCLVRDIDLQSYFFRLFCLVQNKMIWEHEIYNRIQYLAPTSFLHTFEAEDCIVAFNFANDKEAALFREKVLDISFDDHNTTNFEVGNGIKLVLQFFDGVLGNEHKSILQSFDEATGISKNQLKYEKNHGYIHKSRLASPPSPLPSRTQRGRHLRPPPLPYSPRPRSREETARDSFVNQPTSPPPPPPVPPRTVPPDSLIFFPSPTTKESSSETCNDSKSDLMEAIRRGTTLRPVEVETKANNSESKTDNPRGDLLSEIRKGIKLRAVVQPNAKPVNNFLMDAFARALAERAKTIQSDDSSDASETSDADDDDWDD